MKSHGIAPALVAMASITAQAADRAADLATVVQAEREFAARAQVVNARQAFAEYFAPDAIMFGPFRQLTLARVLCMPISRRTP